MKPSARSLVLLLALTMVLAGLLAYEAQRATRSHRVTAERALRDYASVAAWEFLSATTEALDRTLAPLFGPVAGAPAASPYDSLPPPSALAGVPGADTLFRCGPADSGRFFFALDLRTGSLATNGVADDGTKSIAGWLRDALPAAVQRDGPRPGAAALLAGRGVADGRIALYAVKSLRYSGYAQHDAPLAAYGLVTCSSALTPLLAQLFRRHPLLPRSVAGDVANDALVSLRVVDPAGRLLFGGGAESAMAYRGDPALSEGGTLTVQAALPADVAGRLVVAQPASRLPILLALLALTVALAVVALRQLRREQELVRLRADFTSSVSHELRTPLTQILLFAETLELGRAGDEDERRQAISIIVQEARRLAHLVENVLHFSRAERRLVGLRPVQRALAPLTRDIVERFTHLAGSAAVRVRTELDEQLVAAVDEQSLHQILVNLLDNAVKYGKPGGAITLRTSLREECARIEVEDAGPGIPPEDRERIWRPFVRLSRTGAVGDQELGPDRKRTNIVAGSGIGLAVVRELVTAHGGRCWVEAGSAGARFVVELPDGFHAATNAEHRVPTEV